MSEIVLQTPELKAIEPSKAKQIQTTFEPMVAMLEQFEDAYNEIIAIPEAEINSELTAKAKRLRLGIAKIRIEADKVRKAQKEEYLRAGKAIDGVANILKWAVSDKESKLKEIENYFEIQEQKRLEALQNERVELLSKYVEDAEERELSSMADDVWEAYLTSKKKAYEDRLEAERKVEEERLEREKIEKLHNERKELALPYYQFWSEQEQSMNFGEISEKDFNTFLERVKKSKKEFEAEQARIKAENERLAKEKAEAEKKAQAEREKREAEARKERERQEAILAKERAEREKLEAELKAKQEAEAKAEKERKAKEAKAKAEAEKRKKAPIQRQLKLWVNEFKAPEVPVKNEKADLILEKFNAFKKWAENEIENL
ncbi:hypothetical protein GO491_11925 [Flavobacteriaceae bacterium Ap0902]|nr:hypothetical protein [Flavobacteriaceae bacterium Ap0902]